MSRIILYFRKDLRLHDNPTLLAALAQSPVSLIPIFILETNRTDKCGINRFRFLLESLSDLKSTLQSKGSDLLILHGIPRDIFPKLFKSWNVTHVFHEIDFSKKWMVKDSEIERVCGLNGVKYVGVHARTLYDPRDVVRVYGKAPLTFSAFEKVVEKLPKPRETIMDIPEIPAIGNIKHDGLDQFKGKDSFNVPTLSELGFLESATVNPHPGGETEALKRFDEYFQDKLKVAKFEKPKSSPAAFEPHSTTVLSPHLKFGTLSCRLFYHRLMSIYQSVKSHSQPPVSLYGQLLWREFYYTVGYHTENFEVMEGNKVCLYVDWWCKDGVTDDRNPVAEEHLNAWKDGRTGYPWIDAIMTQLRTEGWIHHLARHSVACFLTRGDLFISWERGAEVFEELLLDHDTPLNVGNWLWLSASAFFSAYYRVYSPVKFAMQWKEWEAYVRKYVPVLSKLPKEFLLEPWKAPKNVQERYGCIVGKDYPKRVVVHEDVLKPNLEKMKKAYADGIRGGTPQQQQNKKRKI